MVQSYETVWGGHQSAVLLDPAWSGKSINAICLERQDLCQFLTPSSDPSTYVLRYMLQTCTQCSTAFTVRPNHFSIKHF